MARMRTLVTGVAFIAVAAVAAPALPAQAVPLSDFGKKPKVYIVKDSMRGYDQYLGIAREGSYIKFASHDPSHGITQCFTGTLRKNRLRGTLVSTSSDHAVISIHPGFSVRLRKSGNAIILGRKNYWSTFHRTRSHQIVTTTRVQLGVCAEVLAHADD